MNNLVPLNPEDPTSGICRGQSYGILCGTCKHGVKITTHTFECCTLEDTQAISVPAAWVSWFAIQIVLTTIIVLIIFFCGFHVIGGTLGSFVFFSQVVLDLNLQDCTPGTSHQVIENILRPYAVWSLRLRWLLPFNFCISTFTNTLEALSLDYLFALYPFILIALIVWLIDKCYQNIRGWLVKRKSDVQGRLAQRRSNIQGSLPQRRSTVEETPAQKSSFIHGIATCLILTYGDLVSISFFLLTPTLLNVPYNTSDPNDIKGGPWRSLYNGNYAYFGFPNCFFFCIWAITVVVVFGLLPPFFLMSYPWLPQLLRKCSDKVGQKVEDWYQKKHVRHFLDVFQGHYKDNHRYFAGMWLLYRLILHANDAFAPSCTTGFAIQISFGIFFLLLHSILQPNENPKYNILDSFFLANIALLSTLGQVSLASDEQGSDANGLTIAIAVFLLPPYLYVSCIVIYRIANWIFVTLGCGRQQSDEQQSLHDSSDSDEDDDDGFAGDRDNLRNSATYSSRYGSVNIGDSPVVSPAEVSVARSFAAD